ncbi:ABC-type glycerol-3-phosphate transport system substrate-binding protein [Kribbella amoyensis]|uniref:ABC-type glycerol-3-phosphate transport system substrate-binding protein n=1 Tax=Kribbella amoyensis TaxID=996641 RepID=A0A561B2C4_9ACTN|nr:ABC transporter substrate-binding protein [Kribbella amoyensis]TWD73009.1 ABC-type glycerol-3-phosphate transport system substrate-binding protein [Kribbella amoyensis]
MTGTRSLSSKAIALLALGGLGLPLAACGNDTASGGEVTITCSACQQSPTDPFLQYNYEAAQRFNQKFAGRYRIEVQQNQNAGSSPDRLQYYQRLALADDLPDLFQLNSGEIKSLQTTNKLRDFAGDLDADSGWKGSFLPSVFDALGGSDGQIWAIPQQRDALGMFYNKKLFASVGYAEFPATWAAFEQAAAKLKARGKTALAADGDWATMLMWVNLIGTQPGGKDFLTGGLGSGDYSGNAQAVKASETLRGWHSKGWVNSDSFSGDFQDAAAAYLSQSAASVANGPWFVKTSLKSKTAPAGLYRDTAYTTAPGWADGERGAIVVTGAGWVSGTQGDDDKAEAVTEFAKFVSSPEESLKQGQATGANPPVKVEPAAIAGAGLEPLSTGLAKAATTTRYTYPHVRVYGPAGFGNAWKNLWPAYAKGEIDTPEFLGRLGADATKRAGAK